MRREQYYFKIQTYKKRRVALKKKYKDTKEEKYANWYRGLTKKICYWYLAIRRLDERKKEISILIKKINTYFGVNIKSRIMNLAHKLARNIFYKIGMENKLRGAWLSFYLGRSKRMAELGRKSLTKSFATTPENRKSFYDFKNYIS